MPLLLSDDFLNIRGNFVESRQPSQIRRILRNPASGQLKSFIVLLIKIANILSYPFD